MATDEKTEKRPRVPTPPVTKKQQAEFDEEQEERGGDPVSDARQAIREAQAALRQVEDALDALD